MQDIFDGLLYLTGWPLAVVLILGGLYFTVRTKFVQLRLFGESVRVVFEKPDVEYGMVHLKLNCTKY